MIKLKDIGEKFGALNDMGDGAPGPRANRRVTTTTQALSTALSAIYTPDILAGKNTFLGIVMFHYPTQLPRHGSKQELIGGHYTGADASAAGRPARSVWPYYTVYKVYVPELEPRPLDFENPDKRGAITLKHRIMTFDDVVPDKEALGEDTGAITAGTLVSVTYENPRSLKNPRIVGIGPQVFNINLGTGVATLIDRWDASKTRSMGPPAGYNWSNKGSTQKKATYKGQEILNGDIEAQGLLEIDEASGARLLPDAMTDWKNLTAAFKTKFKKQLKGSGYRDYQGQVDQRMRRVHGDEALKNGRCAGDPTKDHRKCKKRASKKCRAPDGNGSGEFSQDCQFIGQAAKPGRSDHGWGLAVDCDTDNWTLGQGTLAAEFRWLNKYGKDYNFIFNVSGERWHLGWSKLNTVLGGSGTVTAWTKAGQDDDPTLPTGPGEAGNKITPVTA